MASHTDDVRVFAGCLTGRRSWPTRAADKVQGAVLDTALSHWELAVDAVTEDDLRPRFSCRVVHVANHRPWGGFNRAQAAVLECAVLVSRLGMLSPEKIEAELAYLTIAIDKTAGEREKEAWGWLMERIAAWRAGRKGLTPETMALPHAARSSAALLRNRFRNRARRGRRLASAFRRDVCVSHRHGDVSGAGALEAGTLTDRRERSSRAGRQQRRAEHRADRLHPAARRRACARGSRR